MRRSAIPAFLTILILIFSIMAQQQLDDPRIIVRKADRTLDLMDGDRLIKTYKIKLGFDPVGDKEVEGDGRTPEGDFYVFVKNDQSKFTVSLGVSYPNEEDAERGVAADLIPVDEAESIRGAAATMSMPPQKTRLGGEIYIHGGGTLEDWTDGCIALDDNDMRELFSASTTGMPITILP